MEAEQLRQAFATLTGVQDPISVWPIRVVVSKGGTETRPELSRDSYISRAGSTPLTREWMAGCVRVLIDSNLNRLAPGVENGLISLLSTLQIKGTYLTLGAPPPPAERTADWARLHMLATDPELAGRFRVFLNNLMQGASLETAYRNAFEKTVAEMDRKAQEYLAAGKFGTAPLSGRALSPRDFTVREVPPEEGRAFMADLAGTEAAYNAIASPFKEEGLCWLTKSKQWCEAAVKAGSKNARAWAGVGTVEALTKATELNPLWPEPWFRLGELSQYPERRVAAFRKAATLARRDAGLWTKLAIELQSANQYPEAAKAWTNAQLAAVSDADRELLAQERRDVESRRADFEAAERKRIADERERELQRLKDAAMTEIRTAEARANAEMQKGGAKPTKVEEWWEDGSGPKEKADGTLTRVDCVKSGARWIIRTDAGKSLVLKVPDPTKIVVVGSSHKDVGCGPQRPAAHVSVEYAAGELKVVRFQ